MATSEVITKGLNGTTGCKAKAKFLALSQMPITVPVAVLVRKIWAP